MGHSKDRDLASHQHAEGRPGDRTHERFVEQLQESTSGDTESPSSGRAAEAKGQPVVGHHRLHEDREQHDEAEKNSDKLHAQRQVDRGDTDPNVLANARIPRDSDAR